MAELSEERKGQIALKLLEALMVRRGVNLSRRTRQEIAGVAEMIGVEREELEALYLDLLPKLIGRALGFQSVSLTAEAPVPFEVRHHHHDHDDFFGSGIGH